MFDPEPACKTLFGPVLRAYYHKYVHSILTLPPPKVSLTKPSQANLAPLYSQLLICIWHHGVLCGQLGQALFVNNCTLQVFSKPVQGLLNLLNQVPDCMIGVKLLTIMPWGPWILQEFIFIIYVKKVVFFCLECRKEEGFYLAMLMILGLNWFSHIFLMQIGIVLDIIVSGKRKGSLWSSGFSGTFLYPPRCKGQHVDIYKLNFVSEASETIYLNCCYYLCLTCFFVHLLIIFLFPICFRFSLGFLGLLHKISWTYFRPCCRRKVLLRSAPILAQDIPYTVWSIIGTTNTTCMLSSQKQNKRQKSSYECHISRCLFFTYWFIWHFSLMKDQHSTSVFSILLSTW